MKSKNICKFNVLNTLDSLSVSGFVLESDLNIMKEVTEARKHYVILVSQGEGIVNIAKTKLKIEVGDLIFCFKDEVFSIEPMSEKTEYMYLLFEGIRAEELLRRFNVNANNRIFKGFDGLLPLWKESLSRANEQTIDLSAESMLLYTFSRFSMCNDSYGDLINQILNITEENFTDSDLSLRTIADELGYNSKYLSHLFKKKMNVSYSEYLQLVRVKYAVNLCDHGIDSVKNIAFLSGFADPLYFSTVFKKVTGNSPKEYMKIITKI